MTDDTTLQVELRCEAAEAQMLALQSDLETLQTASGTLRFLDCAEEFFTHLSPCRTYLRGIRMIILRKIKKMGQQKRNCRRHWKNYQFSLTILQNHSSKHQREKSVELDLYVKSMV